MADAAAASAAEPRVHLEFAWVLPAEEGRPERLVRGDRPPEAVALLHTGRFLYTGDVPAERLSVVLAIPRDERFLPGSAIGPGATVSFSADDGQTFGAAGDVQIPGDLEGELRPATARDFTHVRWLLAGRFPPGTSGLVSFRTWRADMDAQVQAP